MIHIYQVHVASRKMLFFHLTTDTSCRVQTAHENGIKKEVKQRKYLAGLGKFLSCLFRRLNIVPCWTDWLQSAHNFLCWLRGVGCNHGRTGGHGAIVSCRPAAHPAPVRPLMKRGTSRRDSLPSSPPATPGREPICQEGIE